MRSEFVATVRSRCSDRWRATASVVVPALIMSDAPSRTRPAARAPIWSLADVWMPEPDVDAGVGPRDGLRADRAAVRADEDAVGVEGVEVAADGVGGDVEPLGEVGDGHLPVLGHVGRQVGLAARGEAACGAVGGRRHGSTEPHAMRVCARTCARTECGRTGAIRMDPDESGHSPSSDACSGDIAGRRRLPMRAARSRVRCERQVPLDDAEARVYFGGNTQKCAHSRTKRQDLRMGRVMGKGAHVGRFIALTGVASLALAACSGGGDADTGGRRTAATSPSSSRSGGSPSSPTARSAR